jgi:polar amino acid transport system substrate-binding protein
VRSIKQAGVLRIAADLSYPPLAFREGQVPRGFEVDLAALLASSLGVRLEVRDTPQALLAQGLAGADMVIGLPQTAAPPGLASEAFYTMTQAILWSAGAGPPGVPPLRHVRVAVQAKSVGETVAEQMGAGPILLTYRPAEALAVVSRGEAQAAVADLPLVVEYQRTHRHLNATMGPWAPTPLVVLVRADAPDLLAFTSAAIGELKQNGGLTQLRQRWHL